MTGIPFGKYQLVKRLARGGMAEVFLARQSGPEGFNRLVALKRILPHLVDSQDFVRMFLDEARLAAQLSHPNVVHIYDFGKVDEHFFIAMEFVASVHAGALIKHAEKERLPDVLVARIGADACAGLHSAHELRDVEGRPLQIVHRDVSPPNLLVSYDGAIKLVDFGIAKAVSCVEQTRPGVVKGKFAYMSPEQTTGQRLDGRSDVFSLAIVLWELLAGKVMIPRTDPVDGMRMLRDGRFPPIEKERPDLPPALAAAIGRALKVNREERATALELGRALEEYIKAAEGGIGSSLELAQWLRDRFPRENLSGSYPALRDEPAGTRQATGATRAAPETGDGAALRAASPLVTRTPTPLPAETAAGAITRPPGRAPIASPPPTSSHPALAHPTTGDATSSHHLTVPPTEHPTRWASPRGRAASAGLRGTPQGGVVMEPLDGVQSSSVIVDEDWRVQGSAAAGPGDDTLHMEGDGALSSETTRPGPFGPRGGGAHGGAGERDDGEAGDTVAMDDPDGAFGSGEVTDQDLTRLLAPVPAFPVPQMELEPPGTGTGTGLAPRPGAHRQRRAAILVAAGAAVVLVGAVLLSSGGSTAGSTDEAGPVAEVRGGAAGQPAVRPLAASDAAGAGGSAGGGQVGAGGGTPAAGTAPAPSIDAAPPEPSPAVLAVMTRPSGARVLVGDLPAARSPAHFEAVPAGTYDIRVELKGYQTLARSVDLAAGEHRTVDLHLDPLEKVDRKRPPEKRQVVPPRDGILKVRTRPYSEVFLGARRLGQTPLVVDLKPGSYTLTFKHPGRSAIKRRVTIKPGDTTKLDFSL